MKRLFPLVGSFILRFSLGCLLLPALFPPAVRAQTNSSVGLIRDFKYPEYDKLNHLKSLLSGKTAKQVSNDRVSINELHLETYNVEGKIELIVEAPQCELDTKNRVAWSSGRMQSRSGDNRFAIEGEGFEWRQADTHLVISNQVHTTLHQELFKSSTGTNAAPVVRTTPTQPLEIFSDYVDISVTNRVAVYTHNVRAEDPRSEIRCEVLTIRGLTSTNNQIDTIIADNHVTILNKQDKSRASGDNAVYTATNNIVTLTGHPMLENDQGKMYATHMVLHRNENELFATENVKTEIHSGVKDPAKKPVAEAKPGEPAAPVQPLFVYADAAKINLTNRVAVYTGNVKAEDPKMLLTCESMVAEGAEKGGGVKRILAKKDVVIINKQDHSRATGEDGVYTAADNIITLTGHPMLENDQGKLFATKFDFHRGENELYAIDNVKTEIRSGAKDPAKKAASEIKSGTPPPPLFLYANAAQINLTNKVAVYTGNVRADDPKMLITCEKMTIKSAANTNRIDTIIAEQQVVMVNKQDKSRASGEKAVYVMATDTVDLTGTPLLENDSGKIWGEAIVLNRAENILRATGGVKTEIQTRNANRSGPFAKPPSTQPKLNTATNQPPPEPLLVFADVMNANLTNRIAVYTGHVRTEHPRMKMTCETLSIKTLTNQTSNVSHTNSTNNVEWIVAEKNVVIFLNNKKDQLQATGQKAVYTGETDSVELTGDSTLRRLGSVAYAEPFILDLKKNTIRAINGYTSTVNMQELKKTNAVSRSVEPPKP